MEGILNEVLFYIQTLLILNLFIFVCVCVYVILLTRYINKKFLAIKELKEICERTNAQNVSDYLNWLFKTAEEIIKEDKKNETKRN